MTTVYAAGYFQNVRREMLPFLPQRVERMIDIGCGEGAFGAYCKERFGCECWGIEQNPEAAEHAAANLDRVLTGDAVAQACQLPDRHFDVAVCNDVLEHLVEPEELLQEAARVLRPGGVVVCSIPNIRYYRALKTILFSGDFPRDESGIFDRTHLRFFTRKTIETMFAGIGFRIERLEGLNGSRSRGLALLNVVSFGAFEDCRYGQFACVARPPA
jgi:ubiquinone/menaquinone biosynthesis C-methylase UbiE